VLKVAGDDSLAVEFGRAGEGGEATLELVFEILGAEDEYLGKEQFAGDRAGVGVVQDSPYRDLRSRGGGVGGG
jgi:hypothetical protein